MSDELKAAELESLKARADLLGVKYHPSISAEKLVEKIRAAQADAPEEKPAQAAGGESEHQKRVRMQEECLKLVRVRITCMNPAKREWQGEIFQVANNLVNVKRFVPFNAEEGWHIEHILFQMIKDRQCQIFVNDKVKNGITVRRSKLIKEFAIEVLDPLTPEELHELAQRQAMAGGLD